MFQFARIVSYLFHPAVMPSIGFLVCVQFSPEYVPGKLFLYSALMVFGGTYLIPLLLTLLLVQLRYLPSLEMKDASDRPYPYLIAFLFYYLTARLIRELPLPESAYFFLLGSALAVLVGLAFLRLIKISAHATGMGGVTAVLIFHAWEHMSPVFWPLVVSVVVAGLLASARLYLKAHTPLEIFLGLLNGLFITGGSLWLSTL